MNTTLRFVTGLVQAVGLAGILALAPTPAAAQSSCAPGGFENDGYVSVQGDRLMLGGQTFRSRGVNFTGGRGTPQFPLVSLTHPDGTVHLEEVRPYGLWTDTYDSGRVYAELAMLKQKLGVNAIRVPTSRLPLPGQPYDASPWFLADGSINPFWLGRVQDLLCSCRQLGIKVQIALLWNIQNDGHGGISLLPYSPEYMQALDTYVASIVTPLASDPTILSWEISNEVLPWTASPTDAHAHAVRLIRHLIQQVRSHDPNHLVTSGEVAVSTVYATNWRYPTPEFVRFDLDGTGVLTGIVDYVDYISPHFYGFGLQQDGTIDNGPIRPVIEDIKRRTSKPVAMGEINQPMKTSHVLPNEDDPLRATFFGLAREGLHNACRNDPTCPAGAHPGGSGLLVWEAEPILDLRPGSYLREYHCEHQPPEAQGACDHPWPFFTFFDPPRGVHYNDVWELIYYPDANPQTELQPLAPGRILRKSLHAIADFGGDGTSDIALYRPSSGQWLVSGKGSAAYGAPGDIPVGLDWNGDGRSETVVFRPVSQDPAQPAGEWWFPESKHPTLFGHNGDVPVPGDYDGDGDAEIAVFRPHSNTDPNVAAWYVRGILSDLHYGGPADIPVPADYDGDGDTDIAVFRPATGAWFVRGLINNLAYGGPGDIPVPADYDADGDDDIAVFRPSTGEWYVRGLVSGVVLTPPMPGDIPAPADYDGDSKADFAVFRPSTGQWFFEGGATTTFGASGDIPVVRRPQY
jgi:Cellulase (glycosyl hydrolase family 5)